MARSPFRLEVRNSGKAIQLPTSKQPHLALLNSMFSNQMNVAPLILTYFYFFIVLKVVILFSQVIFVFRFLAILVFL